MSIRVIKQTVEVRVSPSPQQAKKNRNRSLRRQQRREAIADTIADIEKVEQRMERTTNPKELLALEKLHDILYKSYCELIDSEV